MLNPGFTTAAAWCGPPPPASAPFQDGVSSVTTTTGEAFQRAMDCHRGCQWDEAERLYRDVLAESPNHLDALHLLGLLELQSGRTEAATQHIAAAITALEQSARPPAPGHAAMHLNLGTALQAAGRLEPAVASYRRALALDPACASAYSNLGNVLQAQGDLTGAVDSYQAALRLQPSYPEALYNLGNAYAALGRLDAAISSYRDALRLRPNSPETLNNLAHVLQDAGRLDQAVAAYESAVKLDPGSVLLLVNLGTALRSLGRLDDAIARYERALALDPDAAEAHYNLANARYAKGELDDAAASYGRTLALKPDHVEAHFNLANLLKERGEIAPAIQRYREALAIRPTMTGALFNLANLLQDGGQADAAVATWQRLLALEPNHAEAQAGLGNGLHQLGRPEAAIAAYRRALAIKPTLAEAHYNLANTLQDAGDVAGALDEYARAVELRPDYVEAHWNRSLALLLSGDLATGWPEYEWRWEREYSQKLRRPFRQKLWRGEPLDGKRILLHAEQGMGDTLQFCRYVGLVAARNPAAILLEVPAPLLRLMTDSVAGDRVRVVPMDPGFPGGDSLPPFDLHCPLMSLPLAFGTTLDTIPAAAAYLRADPALAARWRERFAAERRPRVGLVWAGGVRPGIPEAIATDRRRSLALAQLAPLAEIAGIAWCSLQKGAPAAQARQPPAGMALVDPMDAVEDFADTAALVAALDLVISVDTSVAHLAAGLGKPVWLLSRFDGCWRWLLERDDSPWYPGLRLYRQRVPGDWEPTIARLRHDLAAWVEAFARR
jgi:tetratricopeptide (TPR) repeat protein